VRLALDQHRVEAALEDVADALVAAVEALGIEAIDVAHSGREIRARRLDHQMVVVGHQAVGVAAPAAAPDDFAERLQELATVGVDEEDGRAVVAARGDVVERAGELDPKGSCHGPGC
jgi:hypothetical protein